MFKFFKKIRHNQKTKRNFYSNGYNIYNKNNKYFLEGNNLFLTSFSKNIYTTAKSVLLNNEYNFSITEPYIMIDIGFNIGITSLYFAKDENIKKIYGFEPFFPTYKNAEENLKLNPELAKKIQLHNYGLAAEEKIENIYFNKDHIGQMSTVKDRFNGKTNSVEQVVIKNAAVELEKIIKNHCEKIFLKIDCEGAEYEILPLLDKEGLLKNIDVIIMEWHFQPPEELLNILKKNGFFAFCNHETHNEVGMIRAVRI